MLPKATIIYLFSPTISFHLLEIRENIFFPFSLILNINPFVVAEPRFSLRSISASNHGTQMKLMEGNVLILAFVYLS